MDKREGNIWTIGVERLRIEAVIGVYPQERLSPQPLEIDMAVEVSIEGGLADDIRKTVNYSGFAAIASACAGRSPELIETLCEDIVDALLGHDPKIAAAEAVIRKPRAVADAACAFARLKKRR